MRRRIRSSAGSWYLPLVPSSMGIVPSEGSTGTLREVSGGRVGVAGAEDGLALAVAGLKLYCGVIGVDLEHDDCDPFGVDGGRCSSCRS